MQKLAVDIGFGSTKFVSDNNKFKFPSAVSISKGSQADFDNNEIFHYEGIDYQVGEFALRDAMTTRDYTFLEKYAPLLLYKAILDSNLSIKDEIYLSTGLSLLNWNKKEDFANKIIDFVVNKERINKIKLKLIPQGKGIYNQAVKNNNQLKNKLILIVDIGYNTLDVIPFENGKAIANEAWATSQGVNLIVDEIRKDINKKYGLSLNESRVNKIMQNKYMNIEGEEINLSNFINNENNKYKEIILNEIKNRNIDIFKSADSIIIGGGGAYIVDSLFDQKNIVFAEKPYEFSNVLGYWNILNEKF